MGWYELAKVGTYTDKHGKTYELTKDRLFRCSSQYDGSKYKSPITVGHPASEKDPAWGSISDLKFEGDTLFFKPGKLVPEFAEMVNKGMYSHVSAAFCLDNWSLDHVAFLGGVAPAIKGLKEVTNVEFSADKTCVIDFKADFKAEFSDSGDSWLAWRLKTISRLFRSLRDRLIETDDVETADRFIREYEIEDIAADPPERDAVSEFSQEKEGDMNIEKEVTGLKTKLAEMQAGNKTLTAELETTKAENLKLKKDEKRREFAEFCEGLIRKGKLLPDQKRNVVSVMESLSDKSETVEFSDGGKTENVTPLELYKKQLESQKPVVEFSELMTHDRIGNDCSDTDDYATLGRSIADTVNTKH